MPGAHHQQAVEMAALAADRAGSPEVKDLAHRIRAAQDPEIESMTAWMEEWGEPTDASMGGRHQGGSGMISEDEMVELEAASGADFDRLFLEMMREHHRSAIEEAQTEQEDGQNAEGLDLAQRIIDDQTSEIEEIESLLAAG